MKQIRHRFPHIYLLSGTPAPENTLNLWTQMYMLDGGVSWGNDYHYFENLVASYDVRGKKFVEEKFAELVLKKVSHMIVSGTAKERPLTEVDRPFDVGKEVLRLYEKLKIELLIELDSHDYVRATALTIANKLRQLSSGFLISSALRSTKEYETGKLDALVELSEEYKSESMIIFIQFKHEREQLLRALPGSEAVYSSNAEEAIDRWNTGETDRLIIHPRSCAHGLNLQAGGRIAVWYNLPWSCEEYIQGIGRINRRGQTEKCMNIVMKGVPIDDIIYQKLRSKIEGQEVILRSIATT